MVRYWVVQEGAVCRRTITTDWSANGQQRCMHVQAKVTNGPH